MLATSLLVRQTINAYVYHTIAAVLFGGMFLKENVWQNLVAQIMASFQSSTKIVIQRGLPPLSVFLKCNNLSTFQSQDYGIDFDDVNHPVKAFKCYCGSKFCRDKSRISSKYLKVSNNLMCFQGVLQTLQPVTLFCIGDLYPFSSS